MKLVFENQEAQNLLKELILEKFPNATDVNIKLNSDTDDRTGIMPQRIAAVEITTK